MPLFYIYDGLVSGLKTNRMLTTMATDPSVRTTRFSEEMIRGADPCGDYAGGGN